MCSQTAGISTSVENAEESGDVGLTGTIGGHVSVMWWPEQERGEVETLSADCAFAFTCERKKIN